MNNSKGTFYSVSTGPGDSELLTLQAVHILKNCPVIFCPETLSEKNKQSSKNIAWDTVNKVVNLKDKTVKFFSFTMEKEPLQARQTYKKAASQCIEYLTKGLDVAFISIGDVSLYSTAGHVASIIKNGGFSVRYIAGVTSFSQAACAASLDLAGRDSKVTIIPGDAYINNGELDNILESDGTKIIMKTHRYFKTLIDLIIEKNMCDRCYIVQKCSMKDERIYNGQEIKNLPPESYRDSYLSVIIILENK